MMDLITVTRKDGMSFEFGVRGHRMTSDMSIKDGGVDAGPSPAELLAGSLGSCIAMMAQFYCRNNGYEGDTSVNLTLELADNPKRIGRIVVDLELPEGVPEDKVETLKRVIEKCPIHETLRNPPAIDIDVV